MGGRNSQKSAKKVSYRAYIYTHTYINWALSFEKFCQAKVAPFVPASEVLLPLLLSHNGGHGSDGGGGGRGVGGGDGGGEGAVGGRDFLEIVRGRNSEKSTPSRCWKENWAPTFENF